MTTERTTAKFTVKPDFYLSQKECDESLGQKIGVNPRYKFFYQTHFTAGDIDQFETYRDKGNLSNDKNPPDEKDNIFSSIPIGPFWEKYSNVTPLSVQDTFSYLFNKFKKGVFIKIKNNKVRVFLPFSKKDYINEFRDKIRFDPLYKDMNGFFSYLYKMWGYSFNPKCINRFIDSWYANNYLFRYEYPIVENDTNIPVLSDMLETLSKERSLPDIELFINKRDFPVLRKDGKEAYDDLFGNIPLLSGSFSKYIPILSMTTTKDFADIPIPTGEDWARVNAGVKFFPKTSGIYSERKINLWSERKNVAVFRGSSTGRGVTIDTNPRLKLAYISSISPRDEDGSVLLDAGITKWNLRPRKLKGDRFVSTIDIRNLPFGLVPFLTPEKQEEYKYLINVDGHVSAFRLSWELKSGCTILLVQSKYRLWFSHLLIPYTHYVPIKEDLSDLISKIKWCKKHDNKCRKIAENAGAFYDKYLSKEGILDYLQNLFFALKKHMGEYFYNTKDPSSIRYEREIVSFPPEEKGVINIIPSFPRTYSLLKGIKLSLSSEIFSKGESFFSNRNTKIERHRKGGCSFLVKTSLNRESLVHEAYVGLNSVNYMCKTLPNFSYTFSFRDDRLIKEDVAGETLFQYMSRNDFTMKNFLHILLQICLALHYAVNRYGFVHNDLTPWNIILKKEERTFDYIIDYNTVYRVKTSLYPVIIDYGRTHVIHNNYHYGEVNMFKTDRGQDIITLMLSSLKSFSELGSSDKDVQEIIMLANFLSKTDFRPKPFYRTGKDGLGDIKYFCKKHSGISRIFFEDKKDLENKSPLALFDYIMRSFPYSFGIERKKEVLYSMNIGSSRQIYEFISSTDDAGRRKSFYSFFKRLENVSINDNLEYYSSLQAIDEEGRGVLQNMEKYIGEGHRLDKARERFESFRKKYKELLQNGEIKIKIPPQINIPKIPLHPDLFPFPSKVLAILTETKDIIIPEEIDGIKITLEDLLLYRGAFELSTEKREKIIREYSSVLRSDTLGEKIKIGNLYTLRTLAKEIYRSDREERDDPIYDRILELV